MFEVRRPGVADSSQAIARCLAQSAELATPNSSDSHIKLLDSVDISPIDTCLSHTNINNKLASMRLIYKYWVSFTGKFELQTNGAISKLSGKWRRSNHWIRKNMLKLAKQLPPIHYIGNDWMWVRMRTNCCPIHLNLTSNWILYSVGACVGKRVWRNRLHWLQSHSAALFRCHVFRPRSSVQSNYEIGSEKSTSIRR